MIHPEGAPIKSQEDSFKVHEVRGPAMQSVKFPKIVHPLRKFRGEFLPVEYGVAGTINRLLE